MHQLLTKALVLPAAEAVERFVEPGAVLGLGGQNINRCPMALVHEVVRQRIGELTVVGCNLSLPLDFLVAAGLVVRTEQGSGNLEKFGTLFTWRRAVEANRIAVRDYSHLSMASRFLAGAMGLPFMPVRSLLGSSVLERLVAEDDAVVTADPWSGEPVVLVRACTPDVSLIHANAADADGNVVIDGVTSHEIDMVRASRHVIVSVEEVLPAGAFDDQPERVTISGAYVSAVVEQPWGAWPTSVYRRYDYFEPDIDGYQKIAKAGDEGPRAFLAGTVESHPDFDAYLAATDPDGSARTAMAEQMRRLL
ncbi:CoA transferase subunit A [Catenulispora subtropica]|uniref:CoA transferase subunit A n=1 Tax=Catenulispora subtropica TaxID=450798 RepID=UPI0031DE8A1B